MNVKGLLILFMDILILGINTGNCDQLSGTFFGVPLLFPHRNNCDLVYNNSKLNYSFYFTSQTLTQPITMNLETVSNGKSIQVHQQFSLNKSYMYFFEMAANHSEEQSEKHSLAYSCKNGVFGVNFLFPGNPTVSIVAFFAGLTFNQSFAVYPVCKDGMKCRSPPKEQYQYYVLFGPAYRGVDCVFIDGLTIQMHQATDLSLKLSEEVHVLSNTVEQAITANERNVILLRNQDHNTYTTLWMQQKVSSCERVNQKSLEGTHIISNKPITVFTNRAKCNPQFSYDSQVVHQMPEVDDWGKTFIIDMQQRNILPEPVNNYLEYEIAIQTAHDGTTIHTTYYPFNKQRIVNTTVTVVETIGVHRLDIHPMLGDTLSHMLIVASSPVLVLYSIRSKSGTKPNRHYSVLQQPVEWFSNKQSVVLQHPTHGEEYKYHISVVIAKEHYNLQDIHVAEGNDLCQSISCLNYEGFTGKAEESNGYMVFNMELSITGGEDNRTQLLLWHRNSEVKLGVTVFAYANDLQYAYSNGYTMESGAFDRDELKCRRKVLHLKKTPLMFPLSIGLLITGLLFTSVLCLVSACTYYNRLRTRRENRLARINQDELRLIEEPHKYDALLLFADEDSRFVKYSIYQPLVKEGYRVLWKHDPTSSTFTPGRSVIESIQRALEVCRMVVLICTKHFGTELNQEVAYCIDIQNSRGVRKMVPVSIEDECQLANQLKKYTQIRINTRNMNYVEHINFICKLKKDLGKPIDFV